MVSEIVDGLERKGLLERERDPTDRRRTLVWLTGAGQDALRRDGEVLAVDAIAAALARMPAEARSGLLAGASALLAAAPSRHGDTAAAELEQGHPAATQDRATQDPATHDRKDTP